MKGEVWGGILSREGSTTLDRLRQLAEAEAEFADSLVNAASKLGLGQGLETHLIRIRDKWKLLAKIAAEG